MSHIETVYPDALTGLIAGWRPGYSLDADFYRSEAVYRKDLETVFYNHWIHAGHSSELPEAGSYFLAAPGEESVIVVRDGEGDVRAFANVCRHRGSRICSRERGRVRAFVCPYHAWAYELDGRLRSKRGMGEEFDPKEYGLKPVRCEIFQGMVFVNLDGDAPAFTAGLGRIGEAFSVYGLERTRVARRETYPVAANWKLAVENFMECYHCAPAHPEYSRCHAMKSRADNEALIPAMLAEAEGLGYDTAALDNAFPAGRGQVQYYYQRNALYPPAVTGSRDGRPVAPLLGQVPGYGGGVADFMLGPVSYGILYPDHVVLYRFLPRGVQRTDMDVIWLVAAGAEEGRDYDPEALTWMWRVTTEEDKKIIRLNQQGVNSRYYEPGPLSEMEDFTYRFNEWYMAQIS